MRQIAEVVRFSPLSHGTALAHLPYEKAYQPEKDLEWIDLDKELNSFGYRCNEFKQDHNREPHILFSGCSITFGTGLFLEEIWSYKVREELGPNSGYFNLAIEGNNISNIVFEIIKYCSTYGNPDIIFLNLPDPYRSMQPVSEESSVFMFDRIISDNKKIDKDTFVEMEKLKISVFQSYKILELFCKSNKISLLSFSWSSETDEILGDEGFKTFFVLQKPDLATQVAEYANRSSDAELAIYARDLGKHFGTAYHEAFFRFAINSWRSLN
jgi:hypothetical protein